MDDNQASIELGKPDFVSLFVLCTGRINIERTKLQDDNGGNPVGGFWYPTIQLINNFTCSAVRSCALQVNSVG